MLGKEEIESPALDELKEYYQRILTLLGEDVEREEWRYAWRVPLALPPAQKEGGW